LGLSIFEDEEPEEEEKENDQDKEKPKEKESGGDEDVPPLENTDVSAMEDVD